MPRLLLLVAVLGGISACAFVAPLAQQQHATTTRIMGGGSTTTTARPTCIALQAAVPVDFIDPSYNLALGAFGVGLIGRYPRQQRPQTGHGQTVWSRGVAFYSVCGVFDDSNDNVTLYV